MALSLYFHPLASYCWKALIALYENETPFTPLTVDLGDPEQRAAFYRLAPLGKFPVLADDTNGRIVPESTIIIEYLAARYPGRTALIPRDFDVALEARAMDRFFDQHVHEPMQKHVSDKLRPAAERDPHGVAQAHAQLEKGYAILEGSLAARTWAAGEDFSLADCAAAPALYYANLVHPLTDAHPTVKAYLARLQQRPSFARVLTEAQPYFSMFPG
jgi:glutathione S-transferase